MGKRIILNFEEREVIRCYPETLLAKLLLLRITRMKFIRELRNAYVPCCNKK